MLVTERMRSLGDHAKSSRQPPLKERKRAKADESAANQDVMTILENGDTHESVVGDDVAPLMIARESDNGTDDNVTRVEAVQGYDDTIAAKRAIIHEWQNWSALHSDELDDPNVTEYFLRHLQAKKPHIAKYDCDAIRNWLKGHRYT